MREVWHDEGERSSRLAFPSAPCPSTVNLSVPASQSTQTPITEPWLTAGSPAGELYLLCHVFMASSPVTSSVQAWGR